MNISSVWSTLSMASTSDPLPSGSATILGISRPCRNMANCRSTLRLNRL